MDEELYDYLGGVTTPENQQVLIKASTLLVEIGIVTHQDDIARILQTAESQEHHQNVLDLYTLLTEYGFNVLRQFGVELEESIPLNVLNEILEGIIILPNYGDPEALLTVAESVEETGPEETFCELLEVVTPRFWFELVPFISYVSDDLITRVKEGATLRSLPEEQRPDLSDRRALYNRLLQHKEMQIARQWLADGGRFLTPLSVLLDTYLESIESDIEKTRRKDEVIAESLVGMLVVSDTPISEMASAAKTLVEDFTDDPILITKTYTTLNKLLKEVDLEKA